MKKVFLNNLIIVEWFEQNGTLLRQKMMKAATIVALVGAIALNGCQEKPEEEKEPEIPEICNEELKEVIQNYVFACAHGHMHTDAWDLARCLANHLNANTSFQNKHVTVGGKVSYAVQPHQNPALTTRWVNGAEIERLSVLDSKTPTRALPNVVGDNFVVTK